MPPTKTLQPSQRLNPYDTGDVYEPSVEPVSRHDVSSYGVVSFDTPEGDTIATIRLTKTENGPLLTVEYFQQEPGVELKVDTTEWELD